jgi:molybdopterin molybdotransferase
LSTARSKPVDPKLLSVEDARAFVIAAVPVLSALRVDLGSSLGRTLAEDIIARAAHPPTTVSAMDGYALRSADAASLPANLKKVGVSRAGSRFEGDLCAGDCVRIFTGATLPGGADTIALQEHVSEKDDFVEVRQVPKAGRHIRSAGVDFSAGQPCLSKGRVLSARDIGLIASCGYSRVAVRRRPRIAILATGDELVEPGVPPGKDQIVSSNSAALAAAVSAWGGEPIDLGIVSDRIDAVSEAIDAAQGLDLLLTSGGASVGEHDLVQAGFATRAFAPCFLKIAMRPGKPVMFGLIGDMPVLGLPGSPVSALVCALIFLRPAIAAMLQRSSTELEYERAVLASSMPENDDREDYVRAHFQRDADGSIWAHPFPSQDSSMLLTLAQADGLVRRRPFAASAPRGSSVEVIVFNHLGGPY